MHDMTKQRFKSRTWMILMMIHTGAIAAEFHVSPAGSDQNPGTKDKPFQTIAHARDSVAKINTKMTGDITVYLGGGTYGLSSPVLFDADDSGMNGHKVIYKAIEGQVPVVSGGQKIKGWQIHDKEKDIYKASVGDLEFRQIHVNGARGIRARYPDKTDEVTLGEYLTGANVTGSKPHQLKVKPEELTGWEKWQNLNEVEVVMVTHWKQKRARIASIAGDTISFQEPENTARSMYHMEQGGTPHWYENAYEFLDAEGEFYLNTQTDTLYYKPRKGEDMSSAEVIVPTVETLLDMRGASASEMVHDLAFEGITFEYSKWTTPNRVGFQVMQSATWYANADSHFDASTVIPAAVQLENASKVEIRGCTVRRTGSHGIAAIRDVVSDCTIVGNLVSDCAAGGIYLLLNDGKSSGNQITDNTIEYIGMCYSDGCGILVARTPDVSILHNEIRHVRYTGISTGWSWDDKDSAARNHDVGYNLIHRVMGLHDDGGGVYTLGKIEGMKIHHNYVHDLVRSKFSGNYGICGIYLDNGSCHKVVHDNVIENVEAAFFSGNKPNYKNTFERNYHNGPLAKIIEKANTVRDNVAVKKGAAWPAEAQEIIKMAGPRGQYRRSNLR
jgi:parallel beta-helix repeat protein